MEPNEQKRETDQRTQKAFRLKNKKELDKSKGELRKITEQSNMRNTMLEAQLEVQDWRRTIMDAESKRVLCARRAGSADAIQGENRTWDSSLLSGSYALPEQECTLFTLQTNAAMYASWASATNVGCSGLNISYLAPGVTLSNCFQIGSHGMDDAKSE